MNSINQMHVHEYGNNSYGHEEHKYRAIPYTRDISGTCE